LNISWGQPLARYANVDLTPVLRVDLV
jgi:hypothetical protein